MNYIKCINCMNYKNGYCLLWNTYTEPFDNCDDWED